VNWGIANPKQRKVLAQLQVSEVLTKESRDAGWRAVRRVPKHDS